MYYCSDVHMISIEQFIQAAEDGDLEVMKQYIQEGGDIEVTGGDGGGRTVLIWASYYGHLRVVKYLIGLGVDINVQDKVGNTVLMYASGNGQLEIVEYFVGAGIDINIRNKYNSTAIMIASDRGHLEVVEFLKDINGYLLSKRLGVEGEGDMISNSDIF